LIPFQGYLTDAAGRPMEGQYDLTFRVYAQLGDENYEWEDPRTAVPVNKGMVNVILGSVVDNPIPDDLTFDSARYIGISVNGGAELEPRQQVLSAIHAADASRLGGSPGGFWANSIEIVPIGGVICYFGDPNALPENWRVCDGSVLNDPTSPLDGQTLPDLRGRVARGPAGSEPVGQKGGADSDDWNIAAHTHSISVASGGEHWHTIGSTGSHKHETSTMGDGVGLEVDHTAPFGLGNPTGTRNAYYTAGFTLIIGHYWHLTNSAGEHFHPCSTTGGHAHTATCAAGGAASRTIDTVPSYVALHYVVRIK
jgi:hypothetical protein